MMNLKKIALIILALGVKTLYAQDGSYNQFYNNPLYTNPAFAGSAINRKDNQFATRIGLNVGNQIYLRTKDDKKISLSMDKQFSKLGGGLGAFILNDKTFWHGVNTNSIGIIYAPTIKLSGGVCIKGGLQLAYVNRIVDTSIFFQPKTGPTIYRNLSYWNVAFGSVAYIKNLHIGFAMHNITEPNEPFYKGNINKLPRKYTLHTGGNFQLFKHCKRGNYFQPYILYMHQQYYNQLNITTNYQIGRVLFGAGVWQSFWKYVNVDAAIAILGYKAPQFQVTYNYSINPNNTNLRQGGHEISMIYLINLKKTLDVWNVISPSY